MDEVDWFQTLRLRAAQLRPFPASMREIPCDPFGPIKGRSFFPGGSGLLRASGDSVRKPSIMIVGNDFGTFNDDYVEAVVAGEESLSGTWGGLINILTRADISTGECFFTNAIMGARVLPPNRGCSPALKDPSFTARCIEFLSDQISIIAPKAIVMLGKEQASIIAAAMPELLKLAKCSTWRQVDDARLQYRDAIKLSGGTVVSFCAIMHPCLRASNMKQHGRRFMEFRDDAAEIEMLKRAARS